jgi:hydroxyethylthiazole kinase-like uncharacterized protein yjeF
MMILECMRGCFDTKSPHHQIFKSSNYQIRMKLFSAEQIRQWDAFTVKEEGISFVDLMERASHACTQWLHTNIEANKPLKIFCGKGNNGGDGLAVARQLIVAGRIVDVYILEEGKMGADCFQENLQRLHSFTTNIHFIQNESFFPPLSADDIVVDCLFGTGLNRPIEGMPATLIQHINNCSAFVVAVDIPSGMFIDKSSVGTTVLKAAVTLTFQTTKLCLLVSENAPYFGKVQILNIGLSSNYLKQTPSAFNTIDTSLIHSIYKKRNPFSHKGHHGHALLIAGSEGKMGAAVLAAKACLRSGVGLLTCCLPKEQFGTMNIALPEAMTIDAEDIGDVSKYSVIGIGPGLGQSAHAENLFNIIFENSIPAVMDADALNLLSKDNKKLSLLPAYSIITPHPKEFDRIFGENANGFERIEKAIAFSRETETVVVLKDHHTLIAHKGEAYFSMNGNAGLAKGGSGDVLTGIITALAAQGYSSLHAAVLGVFLHGTAADIALNFQSEESMLASDVMDCIGKAFAVIANRNEDTLC